MKGYPQMYPTLEDIWRDLLRKIDKQPVKDLHAIHWALEEAYREGHKLLHQPPGYTHIVEQNIELKQRVYDLSVALRKSRDTFVDTALSLRLLRHSAAAKAMDVAAEYIKTVLSAEETAKATQ